MYVTAEQNSAIFCSATRGAAWSFAQSEDRFLKNHTHKNHGSFEIDVKLLAWKKNHKFVLIAWFIVSRHIISVYCHGRIKKPKPEVSDNRAKSSSKDTCTVIHSHVHTHVHTHATNHNPSSIPLPWQETVGGGGGTPDVFMEHHVYLLLVSRLGLAVRR